MFLHILLMNSLRIGLMF